VILEAMYGKTPVIAYAVGGISEVVKNGITGWLVNAGDEPGFVKAINEALSDPHETIIENAFHMVVSEFDNKVIADRFFGVYRRVVGSS
jgi:glycosyltransferase involved in cell wall biosynthesis